MLITMRILYTAKKRLMQCVSWLVKGRSTCRRRQVREGWFSTDDVIRTDVWREIKLDLSPFWRVAVLVLSPFWICRSKRRHIQNGERNQVGFVAVLDLSPSWFCRRFGFVAVLDLSPFWRVAVLEVSPFWLSTFWMCRRFGCRRFGCVAVLVVASANSLIRARWQRSDFRS